MPSSSQSRSSGSLERKAGENWFCTDTSRPPRISWARRICSGLALEIPAIRILPASSRSRDRPDRVRVGHGRVGPVELVEADRLDAEPAQGRLARLPQVVGRAVEGPAAVAGTQVAALGGDQYLGGVGAVAARARAISVSLWPTSSAPRW